MKRTRHSSKSRWAALGLLLIGSATAAADGWEIVPARTALDDTIAGLLPEAQFNDHGNLAAIARVEGAAPSQLVSPIEEDIIREDSLLPEREDAE
ncbi:hypothetical protein [Jannaschia marina]|uniref:hypothetical protein n=1 Tax=Jannaschia marina TaxID=2741674 RepID=UPI0015C6CBF9|nr:hypothetical protein [Jannaschia marina]